MDEAGEELNMRVKRGIAALRRGPGFVRHLRYLGGKFSKKTKLGDV